MNDTSSSYVTRKSARLAVRSPETVEENLSEDEKNSIADFGCSDNLSANVEDHIDNEDNAENEPSCTGIETSEMDESNTNAEQHLKLRLHENK